MDPKLSKGLTREGFRSDLKPAPERNDAMESRLVDFCTRVAKDGSVPKTYVGQFIAAELKAKSNPHELLFWERHRNVGLTALKQNVEEALTGGYFIPAKASFDGHVEQVRRYVMFHDRISRTSFDARLVHHNIAIREHALSRWIERDGGAFIEMTSALWPGMLVIEAMVLVGTQRGEVPFALPTKNGMFLGITTWSDNPQGHPVVKRTTFDKGVFLEEEASIFEGRWPMHFINTFISDNEMTVDQDDVSAAATNLVKENLNALQGLQMMDILRFSSKADREIVASKMPADFHLLVRKCRILFDSELWRNHVRLPKK